MDLSGSPFMASIKVINFLATYGRLPNGIEALGSLLNLIKPYAGGMEQQRVIDEILLKYQLTLPVVQLPVIPQWLGRDTSNSVAEKIIGENTLRPIAFLTRGLQVARSVAYIEVRMGAKTWAGTGFLVGPRLLLTAYHVIPGEGFAVDQVLPHCLFRFNYEEDLQGKIVNGKGFRAVKAISPCEELDYIFIELEGSPGSELGWVSLQHGTVKKGERVNIIQHPQGEPKQISLQNNFVEHVGENVIQYTTSTLPGSSGAPVFNDQWELVAMHQRAVRLSDPATHRTYFRNQGTLAGKMLSGIHLPQ
jgi:V8-like Glu-specific endopeptidase